LDVADPGSRTLVHIGPHRVVAMTLGTVLDLQRRALAYRQAGGSSDFDSYTPHVTISTSTPDIDFSWFKMFPGVLHFGPEIHHEIKEIKENWTPDATKDITMDDILDKAIVAQIPVIIKAQPQEASGRRLIEVQASNEAVDMDGDVVMQDALLKSASSFIATGHLDIDHLSEFGYRLGIPDPSSYIVGRPLNVTKGPNNSTFVEGEISKSIDGRVDPQRNRYDEFWLSLQRNPPVVWFASIYGWPSDMADCSKGECHANGAARYLIKSMDWRSLAFTRSPKNTALTSPTRIVTAKSYVLELAKAFPMLAKAVPQNMVDLWRDGQCPDCAVHTMPSLLGMRQHFVACKGFPVDTSDILAHAMMHKIHMRRSYGV
jgi:hypothetical protein